MYCVVPTTSPPVENSVTIHRVVGRGGGMIALPELCDGVGEGGGPCVSVHRDGIFTPVRYCMYPA